MEQITTRRSMLSITLLLGVVTHAQPVLDFANTGTLPGESYIYHASSLQPATTPGVDQVWDLSTLDTDSLIYIDFVDPATTPDAAFFPTATIATDDAGASAYSAFTATGGEYLGNSIPGEAPMVYDDPMTWVEFPCTYLSSWNDTYGGTYSVSGMNITRTGTITATADGYGTLVMPYGNLTNVLRVSYVEDYTDASIVSIVAHREYTYYMQAGTHYPIVDMFYFSVTVLGNTNEFSGTHWMEVDITTGLPLTIAKPAVRTYPNPVSDVLMVEVPGAAGAEGLLLTMIDAQGRVVRTITIGAMPNGSRTVAVPVQDLAGGIYRYSLIGDVLNASGSVVVQH